MTIFSKAWSLLRAVRSGKDKNLQARRDTICAGCDDYVERPSKNVWGKWILQGFCKACGCGARSMADMKGGKNAYRKMKCPKLKWPGDAKSVGLTLHEVNVLFGAKDRLEYNMAVVQGAIDKQKPLDPLMQASIFGHQPAPARPATGAQLVGKQNAAAASAAEPQAVPADKFAQSFPDHQPATALRPTGDNGQTNAENIRQGRMALAAAQSETQNK